MIKNDDGSVSFTLTKEQWEKYLEWEKNLPKLESGYFGTIGGGIEFVFSPTGIGIFESVRRLDNKEHEIDLTDYRLL